MPIAAILAFLLFIDALLGLIASRGHVLCLGHGLVNRLGLSLIAGVAPDVLLFPMQ